LLSTLFDLTGRVALVTGSTRGLGGAIARGLAEAGADVVINARDAAAVEATVEALTRDGLTARGAAFDVTDREAAKTAVERIGVIDILVNNAGIQRRAPFADFPAEDWDAIIASHLTSVFRLIQLVAPAMAARGSGKIINIGSLTSELGRANIVPYATAKGGVKMMTRGLAAELASKNVQVNAIGPGYFKTELNTALINDPAFDAWVKRRTPAGRWADPTELVGAAVFLASRASDFVNGQIIYVDGGFTAVM
jgi:gluconate 5-dehydrogenase